MPRHYPPLGSGAEAVQRLPQQETQSTFRSVHNHGSRRQNEKWNDQRHDSHDGREPSVLLLFFFVVDVVGGGVFATRSPFIATAAILLAYTPFYDINNTTICSRSITRATTAKSNNGAATTKTSSSGNIIIILERPLPALELGENARGHSQPVALWSHSHRTRHARDGGALSIAVSRAGVFLGGVLLWGAGAFEAWEIDREYVHPDFDADTLENDVMLISSWYAGAHQTGAR